MHFNLKSALLFLAAAFMLAGCSDSSSDEFDYLPVKTDEDSNWGMVGPDGKLLFDDEFENQPTAVINGVFTVEENDGVSVYKAAEKPQLIPGLEDLKEAGVMSEGVIPVTKPGERIKYYNADGKMLFELTPYKNKELVGVQAYFSDGLAAVMDEDGNFGYIDSKGEVKIAPKYNSYTLFNEGYAVVTKKSDAEKASDSDDGDESVLPAYIINKKGEEVAKLRGITILSNMKHGKFAARKNDQTGFVDKKGEFTKLPKKVKSIVDYNDKYVVFANEDAEYGVMDNEGEMVIRARYSEITMLPGNKFLCKKDGGEYYIVNSKDERETTFDDVDHMIYFGRFGFIGGEEHAITFYKEDGKPLVRDEFYDISTNYSGSVTSDYFNADAAAQKLASYISDTGACNVKVGSPIYKYFKGEPKDFTRVDRYTFDDLADGFRYAISGYAYTDSYAASSEPVYTTENYYGYTFRNLDHYDYKWNNNALVNTIYMELTTNCEGVFGQLKEGFTNAMKSKGFKVASSSKAYTLLKKGKINVFVAPANSYSTSALKLTICDDTQLSSKRESLISTAQDNYESIADKQNSSDS